VVPKDQRRAARRRADAVAEQGLAGTAVRDTVRDMHTAVIAATVLPAVTVPN
jgi:hypothetical protein